MVLRDIFIGNYRLSQKFGENFKLANGNWAYKSGHMGIDFATPYGVTAVSPTRGEVIRSGDYKDGYGICVQVWDKEQNIAWRVGHLARADVRIGETVWVGRQIGITDNTGFSTGNHIHFEVCYVDANCKRQYPAGSIGGNVNPLPFFKAVDIKSPVAVDPIILAQQQAAELARIESEKAIKEAQRIADEKARLEAEAKAKAEAERLIAEAKAKAEADAIAKEKADKINAKIEEQKIKERLTPDNFPPIHAVNLDINKVMTVWDYIQRLFKLLSDLLSKI